MKKKRIAIIINGGIGVGFGLEGCVWLVELCEKIALEYELTVFSMTKVNKSYEPKGYQLVDVGYLHNQSIILRFCILFIKIIGSHLKNKFQLFHAFWAFPAGTLALLAGKLFGKKAIITFIGSEVSNIPTIKHGNFMSNATKRFIQFTSKNVDIVIAQTTHHAQKLKDNIKYKRLEVISFGIDLNKFPVTEKALHAPYQFLYLGDINRVKDLPTLIRTFQKISDKVDAKLDIMGFDTLNGETQTLVAKLNLNDKVNFHGRQLNKDITLFLQKAHFLLHTSLSEAHALAVNEALASGVVVFGTRVGILEDLEGEITNVVAVGDAEGLAQKVLDILDKPAKYEDLRKKGIAWNKANDLTVQSQKYIKLYQNLI